MSEPLIVPEISGLEMWEGLNAMTPTERDTYLNELIWLVERATETKESLEKIGYLLGIVVQNAGGRLVLDDPKIHGHYVLDAHTYGDKFIITNREERCPHADTKGDAAGSS